MERPDRFRLSCRKNVRSQRPARRAFDPRLLEGSIPRALFLLAVPIMGANILQVAYQVIDAFWVGRLGAAAVASVSITMPVMFVLIAAGMGFAIAGTTLIAQYTGARDHKMVDHVAAQTLVTIVAVSIVLGADRLRDHALAAAPDGRGAGGLSTARCGSCASSSSPCPSPSSMPCRRR